MPHANYCKKCRLETPAGETCPYCGAALTKSGQRLSFGVVRTPVKDWFCWNEFLRIGLPAIGIISLLAFISELFSGGFSSLFTLLNDGFVYTILIMLAVFLLLVFLLLILQGKEKVHYILDKDGVKCLTYMEQPSPLSLACRFLFTAEAQRLAASSYQLPGLTLVKQQIIPLDKMNRVRIWQEGGVILLYHPKWWQVLCINCPAEDMKDVEAYFRGKFARKKAVTVLPDNSPKKKKRRKKRR